MTKAAKDEGYISEAKPKHPGGRPTLYKPEYAKQVAKLCKMGATDEEIAQFFDVRVSTIHLWSNAHSEFMEAKKIGKDACDNRVERSLYQKAMGFYREAERVVLIDDVPTIVKYQEYVPPSDTAMIFWLKNRRRDKWRERTEVEHGRVGEFDRMSDRELIEFIEAEAFEISRSPEIAELTYVEEGLREESD